MFYISWSCILPLVQHLQHSTLSSLSLNLYPSYLKHKPYSKSLFLPENFENIYSSPCRIYGYAASVVQRTLLTSTHAVLLPAIMISAATAPSRAPCDTAITKWDTLVMKPWKGHPTSQALMLSLAIMVRAVADGVRTPKHRTSQFREKSSPDRIDYYST